MTSFYELLEMDVSLLFINNTIINFVKKITLRQSKVLLIYLPRRKLQLFRISLAHL